MPAIQAVLRSLIALAAKGNRPAQRAIMETTLAIEQQLAAQLAGQASVPGARAEMSKLELARRIAFILSSASKKLEPQSLRPQAAPRL